MDQSTHISVLSRLAFTHPDGQEVQSGGVVCALSYPEPVVVVEHAIRIEGPAMPSAELGDTRTDSLDIVKLAPGSETPFAVQQLTSDWVNEPLGPNDFDELAIELQLRNGQIRWRGSRIVVQAPRDQFNDVTAAIAAFGWLWLNVERVERKLEADWGVQHGDALALAGGSFGRSQGRRLGERAVEATRDRQWFLRAMRVLERGDSGLSRNARRVFFELCHQLELTKRLTLIGDMIESREALYNQASERMFEFRLFVVSSVLEAAILIAIITEIALFLVYEL
ncbi:hypothetical protein [Rhizobium sp. PL01]|uniref:hypothetical protein n=1 Tax=Rhizobium sp. PL01 TaxID=3085631 RepID=UPI002980A4AB|nr:hypothetical protein [Rhizobium sp. PL01]MDW5317846.1 hypothetical protein [Rhizobium sp. PL01]